MSDSNGKKESGVVKTADEQKISTSRRNFTKASLMASPVLMTAMNKPVWATTGRRCTASVLMSGDGSIPIDWNSCRSCSPGYWHLSQSCWSTAGMDGEQQTEFGAFFLAPYDSSLYYDEELQALTTHLITFFPSVGGTNHFRKFARAATASYLNAMALGHLFGPNLPSASDIQTMIAEVFYTSRVALPPEENLQTRRGLAESYSNYLAGFYDEGSEECILPNSGNCPEQGFTSQSSS